MSNSPSKVNSGPPIWLWLILVPFSLVVIGAIVVSFLPEDLDKVYEEAEAVMLDPNKKDVFNQKIAILKKDEAYADHVNLLEGRLALAQSRIPKALELFGKIKAGSLFEAEAALRTGDAHRAAGDFDKAVTSYRLAVEKETGEDLSARMNLASLYNVAGGINLASAELDRSIEINPAHDSSRILRAQIRTFQEDYKAAREDFEAVLTSPGKFSSVPPDFVTEYFQCLMQLNDIETLKEVAKAHLSSVGDSAVKGSVLCKIGEYREAMVALQANPPNSAVKTAMLELVILEEKLDEAKTLANELVRTSPRNLEVMTLAAKAFAACQETEQQKIAEENRDQLLDLKRQLHAAVDAVASDISNGPGRAKAARLFAELADYQEMDRWYQIATMLDPSLAEEYKKFRSGEGFPTGPLVPFPDPEDVKSDAEPKATEPEEGGPEEDGPEDGVSEEEAKDMEPAANQEDAPKETDAADPVENGPGESDPAEEEGAEEKSTEEDKTEAETETETPAAEESTGEAKPVTDTEETDGDNQQSF